MKQLFYFIGMIILLFNFSKCKKNNTNNTCNNYPIPSDTYKYPIQPGTTTWNNLKTGEERLQACQIPTNILSQISTEGLVQSWMDMPINNEIFMSNSPQKAMVFFMENFSGLEELIKRTDAANKLFEKYQNLNPACVTNFQHQAEQGDFTLSFTFIELPLAQDVILDKMKIQQKKNLMKEALDKYDLKTKHSKYYNQFINDLSLFICARIMINCQYQPFSIQVNNSLSWFIENAQFPIPLGEYSSERNIIISFASNFIQ